MTASGETCDFGGKSRVGMDAQYDAGMLEFLTAGDFRPRVGDAYRLAPLDGDPVDAVLATVTEHDSRPDDKRAPFSFAFRTPMATTLGQGTYRVEHADAGALELFLVPIGPDAEAGGMLYEAVFG